jgi:hypothetical protein
VFTVSYFFLSILLSFFPSGCMVKIFSSIRLFGMVGAYMFFRGSWWDNVAQGSRREKVFVLLYLLCLL